jgi:hypothetical protein
VRVERVRVKRVGIKRVGVKGIGSMGRSKEECVMGVGVRGVNVCKIKGRN